MKAFTLIELLVSITILSLMAGLSITAYPKFSEQMSVTGETYNFLAFFRETQSFGISALNTPGQKSTYAFYVNQANSTVKRTQIINPTDTTNTYYINCVINPTSCTTDTNFVPYTLKNTFEVGTIEGIKNGASTTLTTAYGFVKRPNPELRLAGQVNTSIAPDSDNGSFDRIEITIRSVRTPQLTKKIVILSTGQMYVADW